MAGEEGVFEGPESATDDFSSDANTGDNDGWEAFPTEGAGAEPSTAKQPTTPPESPDGSQPQSPAEALNTDAGDVTDGDPNAQQAAEADRPPPFHNHPRWKQMVKDQADMKARLEEAQASIELANQMAAFYQQQLNQSFVQPGQGNLPHQQGPTQGQPNGAQPQGQAPNAPGQQPHQMEQFQQADTGWLDDGALPQGIKPPGEWESQEDEAGYLRHSLTEVQRRNMMAVEGVYQKQIRPVMDKQAQVLGTLMEMVLDSSPTHKGWRDAIQEVNGELFTFDQSGQPVGIKNQALLQYFQHQPVPVLAMWEHWAKRKAPQLIKQGARKATTDALKSIQSKPKGPTQPSTSAPGGPAGPGDEVPDWDAPPGQVGAWMKKKGMV